MARVKKEKQKPETEIKLEALQEAYLEDPSNEKVFHEYFIILKAYARSLALKEIKTKIYLPPEHIDGVATEAVLKLLNQYRKEGWKVWGSFAGLLRWKVVEALYENSQEESVQSLNAYVGNSDSNQELGDMLSKVGATLLYGKTTDDPQETFFSGHDTTASEVFGVLADASSSLPYRLELLFEVYLLLRLRRPKTRLTMPSFKQFYLNSKAEEAFELLLLEIRNRVADHSQ